MRSLPPLKGSQSFPGSEPFLLNMRLSRYIIEPILRQFDNEQRELVLRWRLWKMEWFPYRLYEYLGHDDDTLEIEWGPVEWNPPRRWVKLRKRLQEHRT